MFLEKELSHKLVGCFFAVRNKYGSGHKEILYDRAFKEELENKKFSYITKPKIILYSVSTGKKIGSFIPDYLIEEKILVELKALPFTKPEDFQQLLEYLKISQYEIGYLVNFGEAQFKPKRFIYTNDRKSFVVNL